MTKSSEFFATCPKGLEDILYQELVSLGALEPKETRAGVYFKGSLETAYRVCLWSRLANRLLLPLERFTAKTTDDLYDRARSLVNWHDHMELTDTCLLILLQAAPGNSTVIIPPSGSRTPLLISSTSDLEDVLLLTLAVRMSG